MATWVCEFCHREHAGEVLPGDWEWIYQAAVCPECRVKVEADGGYGVVLGGAYASAPDPRSDAGKTVSAIEDFLRDA